MRLIIYNGQERHPYSLGSASIKNMSQDRSVFVCSSAAPAAFLTLLPILVAAFCLGSVSAHAEDTTRASENQNTLVASAASGNAQVKDYLDESIIGNEKNVGSLSDGAQRVAQNLQILDQLRDLHILRSDPEKFDSLHALHIRQDVTEALLEAYFDVQESIAAIDDEIDHTQRLQDEMSDQRDKAIKYNNILNFASTGTLSILSGSSQLRPQVHFQNAADIFTITAGGVAATLSAYALKQQSGGKRNAPRNPNMLAQILGRPVPQELQLPDSVWTFMCDTPPGSTKSRKQLLIDKWVSAKRIDDPTSKSGQKDIDRLSGSVDLHKAVTIDMLNNRVIMLSELKVTMAQMSRDIQVIMKLYRHPH